jgi:phosphoribosylanthranilate isomerase
MTFIKLCGLTRAVDVERACALGVDAVGFVMWPGSPRYVAADEVTRLVRLLPSDVVSVAVLVTPSHDEIARARDVGARIIQIHGVDRVDVDGNVWIARPLGADLSAIAPTATVVLDAHDPVRHGGTGRTIDWATAAEVAQSRRIVLAGGLTPLNVREAIELVRPFGVDVASGIEEQPGIKSAGAMASFVAAVREART